MNTNKLIVIVSMLLFLLPVFPVSAEENEDDSILSDSTKPVYSLNLNSNYQEIHFVDNSGLATTLTIRKTALNGERIIGLTNADITMHYKIMIVDDEIDDAYDAMCTSNTWNITSHALTIDSNIQATYTVNMKKIILTAVRHLQAKIVNSEVQVSYY